MHKLRALATLPGIAIALLGFSQQSLHKLSGVVRDASNATVPGATVTLMQASDSTLESFTAADADGHFLLKKVSNGRFRLQVSMLGFQTASQILEVKAADTDIDLGSIRLEQKNVQLKEVTVAAEHIPIRIKGDTIEYNAKAFKTQPNAAVEDLLKKLPGVEVDKDGTIKAQGKTVNKVLVDGKEFFGDDPKMATKNLPADAINQVQVYDKKSDVSEFTGIDDGQRDKTINLKLKDDKKNGTFGNISGAYGTDDRYEGKGNLNRFNRKMQLSAIGSANNTNQQPFSVTDYINFMGGMQNMMSGGKLSLNSNDLGMPLNFSSNDGFTDTKSGGLNFNYELGKKTDLRSSYFYNNMSKEVSRDVFRQNFLGSGHFNSDETSLLNGTNASHRINTILKHRIDSAQQLILKNNLSLVQENSTSRAFNTSTSPAGAVQTENSRFNRYSNDGYKLNSSLTYLNRLNKKGRNFSADLSFGLREGQANSNLNSTNRFMPGTSAETRDSLNQVQRQGTRQLNYGGRLSYTEPIGKHKYLELVYGYQESLSDQHKDFSDVTPQQLEVPNPLLSNQYTNDYRYNRFGSNLKFSGKEHNVITGVFYQLSRLEGSTQAGLPKISKTFEKLLPRMIWNYSISQSRHLELMYQTSLNEPSVDQLQPVVNNSNPLSKYVGNPELLAEYAHNASLSYSSFDQFSFTNFFAAANASYTLNKITNSQSVDNNLVQTYKPVNVDHDLNLSSYVSFGTPLRFMGARINTSLNSLFNKGILYVNNAENNTERWVNTLDLSLENRKKEIVDITGGVRLTQNTVRYSMSSAQNQSFINKTYYADLATYLKSWTLATGLDYNVYAGNTFSASEEVPVWKASVSRHVLKNNRGELKLSVTDILNRNVGIHRTSDLSYIQDERIRSLGRYALLSFTYSLSKFPDRQGGGIKITTRG